MTCAAGSTQYAEQVMQTIRQRGRDPAAIHDILSQVHHQSPLLLHALLESNLEELSEFIQVGERFEPGTPWLSHLLTTHRVS